MNESPNSSFNEAPPNYGRALDLDLEFPDWSGQLPSRHRGSKDAWIEYCRSNLPKLRAHPGHAAKRREHGINAEFHL